MVLACTAAHSQMASCIHFTSLKTTPPCLAGSRAWESLFKNVVYGPRGTQNFLPSAWAFIAPLAALTAVASGFFFYSPILCLKSYSFKSWSSCVVIFAIFIPNITVNSILSNNIGEQRSSVSIWQDMWEQLMRWKRRSYTALKTFPSSRFIGEFFAFLF